MTILYGMRDDCAWTATFDPWVQDDAMGGDFEDRAKIVIVTIRVRINVSTCEYSDVYTQ